MTVRVPNPLFKDWLMKHYSGVISEAMGEVKKAHLAVNFVAEGTSDASAVTLSPDEAIAFETAIVPTESVAPGPAGPVPVG